MLDRNRRNTSDERALEAALDRHWDAVLARTEPPTENLEPDLASIVRRVHALDIGKNPHPAFAAMLWEDLMDVPTVSPAFAAQTAMPFRLGPEAFPGRWHIPPPPRPLSRIAAAILLVVLLAGSAFAALYPLRPRDGGGLPLYAPLEAPSAGVLEFLWESKGGPDPLIDPYGLGIAPDGNLWVADGFNDNFQIFAPDGTFLEAWGVAGSEEGQLGFHGSTSYTYGDVAFDADGNFYVADTGNHRVQKFAPDRSFLLAWGSRGTGDGQFMRPGSISVAGDGTVYVGDESRHDVQKFDVEGTWLGTIGEQGVAEGQFLVPAGVTVDAAGDLWVADFSNHRIQRFGPTGELLDAWGGFGNAEGQLHDPNDVAVDRQGRIYVADTHNSRLQVFAADGQFLAQIGGWGTEEPGTFTQPIGVAVAENGAIFVSDTYRVQAFRLILPAGHSLMP